MEALVLIKLQSDASPLELMNEVSQLEEVEECFLVSGEWPIVARIKFKEMDEITSFVVNKLPKLGKIIDTNTLIVLDKKSK